MVADIQPASKLSTGKVALLTILASETVFFVTLLVAYAALRGQLHWPVQHTLTRLALPLANTLVLVVSVLPASFATTRLRQDKASTSQALQAMTLALGLIFVAGQIYEFGHAGMRVDDQALGGVFFTLVGFHALHVLAGMAFIIINLVRTRLGDFSAGNYESVELGTWFWYYVTAVWIVLFSALYLV